MSPVTPASIGGCRLTGIAGAGGFAVTYAAEHPAQGPVAIKVLSESWTGDEDVAGRFRLECDTLATAAGALGADRAGVVPRYVSHGVEGGAPYLITELCAGGSLAKRLPLTAKQPADRVGGAAWVVARAATCMAAVHQGLGVVHRDLTPANLLFRRLDDGSEELTIADFGLVRDAARQAEVSLGTGTTVYASPEVLEQGTCDHRSDVFSLGVIAWELLTGERPPAGRPLTRLDPQVPYELAAAVAAMTAADPPERPDLERVALLFEQHATGPPPPPAEPIAPLPPQPSPGAGRRAVLIGGLVAAGSLAAGIGVGLALAAATGDEAPPPATTRFASADGNLGVELDAEWTVVDADPDDPAQFLAYMPERDYAFTVGGSLIPSASRFIEIASAGLAENEIVGSGVIDDAQAWLELRQDDRGSLFHATTWSCGTLVALTHGPAPLPDDIVAKSRAAAATIVVTGQPELAPAGPDPSGFERFERNGLSIAAATGRYELEESNDHCLFLRGDNESLDVTFTPLAGSELLADQNERAWSGLDGAPLSRTEPEPGRVLLEGVDPEGDAHVVYLIDSGAGTYQIRLLDLDQSALPPEELADLVQMATTLEVTGETAAD